MAGKSIAVRRARPRGKPQDGELSPERLAFCEGILEGKGHRVAYEESGFKARGKDAGTNARQLLKEPEVQAYLAARRIELRETKRTAAERVVDEVSAVAFANLAEFGAYELHGPEDLLALPEDLQRLVKGWKWDRHGNFVLQFEDRSRAREQLMKYFGLYQADRRNDQDEGAMLLTTALWQFVISLHISKGLPIATALQTAEANPELVEEWGRRHGVVREP
ncbi:MAG: terminase small subunit [Dehalococcoidia bacterium]